MAASVQSQSNSIAPLLSSENAVVVPDSYIIVFKDGFKAHSFSTQTYDHNKQIAPTEHQGTAGDSGRWSEITKGIKHIYDLGSFQGVAGQFHADTLAEICRHPAVAFVECDTRGQQMGLSSFSYLKSTREHHSWGLAPNVAQNKALGTRPARIYLYDSQDGQSITVSAVAADMSFCHQDSPDVHVQVENNTHCTSKQDAVPQHASRTLVFDLAEGTQPIPESTLSSSGEGTVSDFIAVTNYVVKSHLQRKDGGEKSTGGALEESVLSVPFAFSNSQAMVLALTKAIESGLHLALGAGADTSRPRVATITAQ